MGDKGYKQFRKEFQIKLQEDIVSKDDMKNVQLILKWLRKIENDERFDFNILKVENKIWKRLGDRYAIYGFSG